MAARKGRGVTAPRKTNRGIAAPRKTKRMKARARVASTPRGKPGRSIRGEEFKRGRITPPTKDPYRSSEKQTGGTSCAVCGLVVEEGVWKPPRKSDAADNGRDLCPACRRIRDDYPGGLLKITGRLPEAQRQEILNRARNVAEQEAGGHPLERFMRIAETAGETILYFTGGHVPVRIGKALRRDFGGSLSIRYTPNEKFAIAHWTRE